MSDFDGLFIFNKLSSLFSLWLTIPAIFLSIIVCIKWYPEALVSLKTSSNNRTATQWLILGVAVGFAGSIINNFTLCIIMVIMFLMDESVEYLYHNRIYSNIICQITGISAAYCHVRAVLQYSTDRQSGLLKKACILSVVGATAFVLTIIYITIADLWTIEIE